MPTARTFSGNSVGVVNNTLYAIGGFTGGFTNVVEAYDPATDNWTNGLTAMPTPRDGPGVGVVNGIIYAVGGNGGFTTNEAYNPVANSWSMKASMTFGRRGLVVAVVDDILYAIGGFLDSEPNIDMKPQNAVEAYNPMMNDWSTKTPMLTRRVNFGAGVVGGKIYAVGGHTIINSFNIALDTLEVYDPAMDKWSTLSPMPTPRHSLKVSVVNGILYAIGGTPDFLGPASSDLATVEAYDPVTDTWHSVASMPTPRVSPGAGVVDGTIYAVGGSSFSLASFLDTNEAFTPPPVPELVINNVSALVVDGVLNQGQGNALTKKLEGAIAKLDQGNITAAINKLQSFINQVNALLNAGNLTPDEGQLLIDAVNRTIVQLIS